MVHVSKICFSLDKLCRNKETHSSILGAIVIHCRYNSDDPDASNDGASNYSYDGMEPPLLLSR